MFGSVGVVSKRKRSTFYESLFQSKICSHAAFFSFVTVSTQLSYKLDPDTVTVKNFWMVQIFAYFEHVRDYPILARQLFICYSSPDVPINMVATYHQFGWWKKHVPWVDWLEVCHRGCGLKDLKNLQIRSLKFYSNGKFNTIQKHGTNVYFPLYGIFTSHILPLMITSTFLQL